MSLRRMGGAAGELWRHRPSCSVISAVDEVLACCSRNETLEKSWLVPQLVNNLSLSGDDGPDARV